MMPIKDSYLILKPGMEVRVTHRNEEDMKATGMFYGIQTINGNISGIVLKKDENLNYYPFNRFIIDLV